MHAGKMILHRVEARGDDGWCGQDPIGHPAIMALRLSRPAGDRLTPDFQHGCHVGHRRLILQTSATASGGHSRVASIDHDVGHGSSARLLRCHYRQPARRQVCVRSYFMECPLIIGCVRIIFELFNDTAPKTCEKFVGCLPYSALIILNVNLFSTPQLPRIMYWRERSLARLRAAALLQKQHHSPLN